jgi:hypothetical protein
MTTPFTGLFVDASCNSRFSYGGYTRSYGTVSRIGLLGQNCKPYMGVHYAFSIHYLSSTNNGCSSLLTAHALNTSNRLAA